MRVCRLLERGDEKLEIESEYSSKTSCFLEIS